MPVFSTFSKRKRAKEKEGKADLYQYESIPPFLRKQTVLVLSASLGSGRGLGHENWQAIAGTGEREIEGFPDDDGYTSARERCLRYISSSKDVDNWLSVIEMACIVLSGHTDNEWYQHNYEATQSPKDALEEINERFREHEFGFQFEGKYIHRIDDQYVHSQVVKPALQLLSNKGFEKAAEEFSVAHRHYRERHYKDAIVAANRAFEATLKAICKQRKWSFPEGARATELVTAVRSKGLFPAYLERGLDSYMAMMKTGLPGVRNNAGGHGQDPDAPSVPEYIASYAIHMTAANIVMCARALQAKGS